MDDLPNGFTGFAKRGTNFRVPQSSTRNTGEYVPFDQEEIDQIPEYQRRWAWVEIDTKAIQHNVREVKRRLRPGVRLMAVVKADGYGHGAIQCARAALAAGADALGVATVDEGIVLRKANINVPILVLSEPPIESVPLLLGYKLQPSVYSIEFAIAYAEMADEHNMRAPYHLAVNTGMNRIGVRFDEVVPFMSRIAFHRALDLQGTFTHFATADMPENLDFQIQLKHFDTALEALRGMGVNPGLVHAANSAAIIRYPEAHFDMVRLGISLYGFHPCKETIGTIDLQPAMSVRARITAVKTVPMSEGVSYGLNYRSPGSVLICTIPVGYADGLRRALSGRVDFIVQGRRFPQVGNICMDQCMFEVDLRTSASLRRVEPRVGDVVTIIGVDGDCYASVDDQAELAGTIPHEITIGYAQRMPRFWK
ncbi:MAG: alanine racemase [Eggerthellaceae bacterium]|jgi:alanine racemase